MASRRAYSQAVKRNAERFPKEFMFQLSKAEFEDWRSQVVISNPGSKMGLRGPPHVFTEHGVVMLSAVLRSKAAVEISIGVVLAFVKLRRVLASNKELARKVAQHDQQIGVLFDQVEMILDPPESKKKKKPIGFICA
jgi:hypothetical protein